MLCTMKVEWTEIRAVPYGRMCPFSRFDADRRAVDSGGAQTMPLEREALEPPVLDRFDGEAVLQEAVHREGHAVVRDPVVRPQKAKEHVHKIRIGVGQGDRVPALRAFRPVEHAAGDETRVADTSSAAPVLLRGLAQLATAAAVVDGPAALRVAHGITGGEHRLLLRSQPDVADPDTDRAHRGAHDPRNVSNRETLLRTKVTSQLTLFCLHERMFAAPADGRRFRSPAYTPRESRTPATRMKTSRANRYTMGAARHSS